jgi:hypothetical protein
MPKPGNATTWIMNQPFFSELNKDLQNEAGSFSFIWGIFELRVIGSLGKDPSASLGRAICGEYANSSSITKIDLNDEIHYFKKLFFNKDQSPTEVWQNACFRENDRCDEIKAILLNPESTFEQNAEALIRIVLRFRNNFFHGFKWAYALKGQINNFVYSSSVLVKLMPAA